MRGRGEKTVGREWIVSRSTLIASAMDLLQGMQVFARVAQLNGFAAAARELSLSNAAVTKHVAALEARVGARLLERTPGA